MFETLVADTKHRIIRVRLQQRNHRFHEKPRAQCDMGSPGSVDGSRFAQVAKWHF